MTTRPDHEPDIRAHLASPRYTALPFPPYRYEPGVGPHPKGPGGHSCRDSARGPERKGAMEEGAIFLGVDRWQEQEEYLYGADLYNHGYWWEAHEAWEGLWKAIPREDAAHRFIRGLIQAGACYLQMHQRKWEGARRLRAEAIGHLLNVPRGTSGRFMGVEVGEYVAQASAKWEDVLGDGRDGAHRGEARCLEVSDFVPLRLIGD